MYKEKQAGLIKQFEGINASKIFVHSDSFKTLQLIKIRPNKNEILEGHVKLLESLVDTDGLILPAFNYQFPKEKVFDLYNTKSEVGHIPEFYRSKVSTWRNHDPMFSVCGTGDSPIKNKAEICPFDDESIFSHLVRDNGHIIFYGASIKSATIIHYAEFLSNVAYRYWKKFNGELIVDNEKNKLTLNSHFRPIRRHLDYNWSKIKSELEAEGILKHYNPTVMGVDAKMLMDFWCNKLSYDHLYLLDDVSRAWVEPMLEYLGRPFLAKDFED
ncbi:MAG: aminoglycoside N3'-acetyltransferase [Psychroserpens sp.]|jgi:aminoglycoside N3'-acetyltransferase